MWCSSSNSPESGIGMSSTSLPSSDQDQSDKAACSDVIDGDDDDEYFEAEPLPILGKCKALYPFEGEFLDLELVLWTSS